MLRPWLQNGAVLSIGPDRVLLGLGSSRRISKYPTGTTAFYAPDFFLEDQAPWIQFETVHEIGLAELEAGLQALLSAETPAITWEGASETEFRASFDDLARSLRSGALEKGVPVVFERARNVAMTPSFRARLILRALAYSRGLPVHLYGFWNSEEGILGATPETLLASNSQGWTTMALAGTRRDGDTERGPILEDAKELREHRLVIDGISRAIAPFGRAIPGETGTVRLPSLTHLYTPVRLDFSSEPELANLIRALHPTPALGAFPREEGMKWLRSQDRAASLPRRRFGAPFGISTPERSLFVVAIRCAQWSRDLLQLGAGCGVIAESDCDREWKEIQAKLRAVKGILGL